SASRVHDPDLVATALAVERVRVEVSDQPGPEHRDGMSVHVSSVGVSMGHGRTSPNANARAGLSTNSRRRAAASTPAASRNGGNPSSSQPNPGDPPSTRE